MKKMFISFILTTISASTGFSAISLPLQTKSLSLSCSTNQSPGSQLILEVFAATQTNPNFQIRITRNDMNLENEVILEDIVNENFGERFSTLSNSNIKLEIIANNRGIIEGKVSLRDGKNLVILPVTCQKYYQIMKSATQDI